MTDIYLNPKKTDYERRQIIFDGAIISNSASINSIALCDFAKELIDETFLDFNPQTAQFQLKVSDFVNMIGPLKSRFTNHIKAKLCIQKLLAEFGCDLNKTYFDVPRIRIVTHGNYLNEEAFPGETIAVMEMLEISSLRIQRFSFEPRISYAIIGN